MTPALSRADIFSEFTLLEGIFATSASRRTPSALRRAVSRLGVLSGIRRPVGVFAYSAGLRASSAVIYLGSGLSVFPSASTAEKLFAPKPAIVQPRDSFLFFFPFLFLRDCLSWGGTVSLRFEVVKMLKIGLFKDKIAFAMAV